MADPEPNRETILHHTSRSTGNASAGHSASHGRDHLRQPDEIVPQYGGRNAYQSLFELDRGKMYLESRKPATLY